MENASEPPTPEQRIKILEHQLQDLRNNLDLVIRSIMIGDPDLVKELYEQMIVDLIEARSDPELAVTDVGVLDSSVVEEGSGDDLTRINSAAKAILGKYLKRQRS